MWKIAKNPKIFDNRTECWARSLYVCVSAVCVYSVCVCAVWECMFMCAECLFFSPSINNKGNCCHKYGKSHRSCHNNLTQLKRNEHMLHAPPSLFDWCCCLRPWPRPWQAASAILAILTVSEFGFVYETHKQSEAHSHTVRHTHTQLQFGEQLFCF